MYSFGVSVGVDASGCSESEKRCAETVASWNVPLPTITLIIWTEKVSKNPALVRELADRWDIPACQAAKVIRSHLKNVEGLDDFMRLTGVVKEHVTCVPPAEDGGMQLQDLGHGCWRRALANKSSSDGVSFRSYRHIPAVSEFMCFGAFSGIEIHGELHLKVSALQRLPTFDHFTSLSLSLNEPDERLFSSLTKYVHATTMLPKLRLYVASLEDLEYASCWTLLLESIAASTSITLLFDIEHQQFERTPVGGCGMRLEDLHSDCWSLLRRYPSFDDVKGFTAVHLAHSTSS
ncbi:hypothetical protein MRX96_017461 [Rhipicephalus microplus]